MYWRTYIYYFRSITLLSFFELLLSGSPIMKMKSNLFPKGFWSGIQVNPTTKSERILENLTIKFSINHVKIDLQKYIL